MRTWNLELHKPEEGSNGGQTEDDHPLNKVQSPRSRGTSAKTKIGCETSPMEWKLRRGHLVFGVIEDGVQAFTDLGIERLIELIRSIK